MLIVCFCTLIYVATRVSCSKTELLFRAGSESQTVFSLGAIDCVGLRVFVDKFDEIVNN